MSELGKAGEFAVRAQVEMKELAEIVGVKLEQVCQNRRLLNSGRNDFDIRGCLAGTVRRK